MKDRTGRTITYLRLSVTELCNLRCRYCMPPEGVLKRRHEEMLTQEEMITAVRAAASLGIRKVRVTGGEPLVKKNILSICRHIKDVDGIRELCITSNGILLPRMAEGLREAGVDRVNISLDTLDPGRYREITRGGRLDDALKGLDAALEAGFEKVKINAVLLRNAAGEIDPEEIVRLAEISRRLPVDVRFIELMPMPGNEGVKDTAFISAETVLRTLPEAVPLKEEDLGKWEQGTVARLYRLPGAKGNIGLISAMSAHFCSTCNRLRLTADGHIRPCLHDDAEYSIKGLSEEEMRLRFIQAIEEKPAGNPMFFARNSFEKTEGPDVSPPGAEAAGGKTAPKDKAAKDAPEAAGRRSMNRIGG